MSLPYLLILFRLFLAPIILVLAYVYGAKMSLSIVVLMYLGLLSDIFDGIIARKQGISSEKMRRLDSQTDLVFWVAIAISCYLIRPQLIMAEIFWIGLVIFMELMCYAVSLVKFGKETCTHAFLSKFWGLTLLLAFTSIIGFGYGGWALMLAIVAGLISQLDVILIILLLPHWTHDIPSCYHAYLIRKGISFKKSKYLNS